MTAATQVSEELFPLGRVLATPGALAAISLGEIGQALFRHQSGDWGDICAEDAGANERALADGDRILSVYARTDGSGEKFWIITEADRASTTVLLPEEY